MSETNKTTQLILKYLFDKKIYAWRQNSSPIPLSTGGFRPAAKSGLGDIIFIHHGHHYEVEIKTGKDRLRPSQIGHRANLLRAGATYFLIKNFDDFLNQFSTYLSTTSPHSSAEVH